MPDATDYRRITFEVATMSPLPAGEQVFVAGDHEALGNWAPDGLALARFSDNLWSETVELPAGRVIEYKITRGSWDTEELGPDGTVPANRRIPPTGDHVLRHVVHHWKDARLGPAPRITGDFRVHERVASPRLRLPRKVIVWLPPSYETEVSRRYPVLYMQDGQQVFDPLTSTWNQDWEVDERCTQLIEEGRLEEILVVGIYSTDDRRLEYCPSRLGSAYAEFVVSELKPMIDAEYRTLPGPTHTAVAGSSMGATISFFLAWTRPEVFGAVACLSPAFRYLGDQTVLDLVREANRAPPLRIFLYGGAGDDLERQLLPGMREMAALLKAKGFRDGENLLVVEDPDGRHHEAAWARQTERWLLFLFGRGAPD